MTRSMGRGNLTASDGGIDIYMETERMSSLLRNTLRERELSGVPKVRIRSAILGDQKQADDAGAGWTGKQTGQGGDDAGAGWRKMQTDGVVAMKVESQIKLEPCGQMFWYFSKCHGELREDRKQSDKTFVVAFKRLF